MYKVYKAYKTGLKPLIWQAFNFIHFKNKVYKTFYKCIKNIDKNVKNEVFYIIYIKKKKGQQHESQAI